MNTENLPVEDVAHRDPISGEPGVHPLGTGIGAAVGGAAAGAAIGSAAGPVGTTIGAAVGAVVGGLAGKEIAETIDPTDEYIYWRENFTKRPYVESGATFDDYGPAYEFGVISFLKYREHAFDDVQDKLSREWEKVRGKSALSWEKARMATRDAWDRTRKTK